MLHITGWNRDVLAQAVFMSSRSGRLRLALLWTGFIGMDTAAQIAMKVAANNLSPPPFSRQWVLLAIESPMVWIAVACLIAVFGLWLRILDASHLAVAFAATSLTLVGVLVGSWLFLGESMNPLAYVGAGAIVVGVALLRPLSQSESSSSNQE
jgi:drug/metabolite transporter (DMT)-like permease